MVSLAVRVCIELSGFSRLLRPSSGGPGVGRSVPKMNQWDEVMSRLSTVHGRGRQTYRQTELA